MPTYRASKMCDECPFRANAPPGWLGPWTTDQLEAGIHGESDFVCHKDVAARLAKGQTTEEIEERGRHCVGFLRYQNSVLKTSRDPRHAAGQRRLCSIPDQPTIPPFKLREYHDRVTWASPRPDIGDSPRDEFDPLEDEESEDEE